MYYLIYFVDFFMWTETSVNVFGCLARLVFVSTGVSHQSTECVCWNCYLEGYQGTVIRLLWCNSVFV